MKKKEKIQNLKANPNNPRLIKDQRFKKAVRSLQEFPEMLEKRPIVVNEDLIILGGNMRYQAAKHLKWQEVWIDVAEGWSEERQKEFTIKDNASWGEWDMDMLANEGWDLKTLETWGLEMPVKFYDVEPREKKEKKEKCEYCGK